MYEKFPTHYWAGLITLAKVLKIEIGKPHDFDRPSTKEEALDRLERTAGPHARKMLEDFLAKVEKLEADQRDKGTPSRAAHVPCMGCALRPAARRETYDILPSYSAFAASIPA